MSYELVLKENPQQDGPYVSEDFADTLAAHAMLGKSDKNPWCQVLALTDDRQKYKPMSIEAADNDVHSSWFFRILHYEMNQDGNLPKSCEKYLAEKKFSSNFKNCLALARMGSQLPSASGASVQ